MENEARRHSTPGNPQVELHAIRRAEKIAAIHRKYIENSTIFDATVLNIGDLSELYAQLDTLASLAFYPVDRERVSAKVFVICGNSFSGKDQLINAMQQMQRNRAFIYTKGTTREKRASDGGELAHMPADAFPDTYDITYEKQGHTYGISTAEIWHGLSRDRVLLVAINDAEIIVKMKQIFGQSCVVLYLHFDQIADELEKQEGADIPANELMLRLSVAKQLEATYFHNLGLFDHVLLNTTNIEDLYDQAFNVYDYYCL
ncbi:MAG: hypothetical protein H6981_14725 [Gammaproteobacteria bacterium]|nr:hypothetical protein [Gammaproteobacteria bacterium]MCP5138038.1 hypothetical protein [Gammaproteobacteria bacterium]